MAAADVCSSAFPPDTNTDCDMGASEQKTDSEILSEEEEMVVETPPVDTKALALQKKEEGNAAYKSKSYGTSIDLYTQAIELDPTCAAYYGNRSAAYMMVNDFQAALEDARKAFTLDNAFVKAYHRAAKCYIATGETNNALRTLQQASLLEPKNKLILDEMRVVQLMAGYEVQSASAYEKGDYRKIEFCMRRLLEYAPHCISYKGLQAECMALTGKYSDAQVLANEILQKDKNNKEALYVRGICLYYQDQTDRAFNVFQHLLRTAPDFKKAKEAYKKAKNLENTKESGNTAFRSGKYAEALDLYSQALQIDALNKSTNSKLYCNRATVNSRLGKHEACINDCSKAIDLDPAYLKAYLRRAKSYMETEQYEEAVRDYEKINKLDRSQENRRLLKEAKLELKKSKRKDYYKVLGVGKDGSDAEIKKAYRKEALKHHPDRHAHADDETKKKEEVLFKEVGEAYSILSDKEKRYRYDNGLDIESGGMDFGGDFDPNIIFQSFFGGGGGGGFSSMGGQRGGGGHSHGGYPGGFSFSFG